VKTAAGLMILGCSLLLLASGCSSYRVNVLGVDVDQAAELLAPRRETLDPETEAARHNDRGVALERGGDLRGALDEYREAVRLRPDYVLPLVNMGNVWVKLNHLPNAEEAYRRALAADPGDAAALNNLSWVVLRMGGDPGEAVELTERALKTDPEPRFAYLDTLGWALYRAGDRERARAVLEEALDLPPADAPDARAETRYHLGMVLEAGGDFRGAREEYRRALDLRPPSALARELRRRLREVPDS